MTRKLRIAWTDRIRTSLSADARRRRVVFATSCAMMLTAALSAPTFAGDLSLLPSTMTPIYMNSTIGLLSIDAARRNSERVYGRTPSQGEPASERASPQAGPAATSPSPARFDFGADPAVSRRIQADFETMIRMRTSADGAKKVLAFFDRKPLRVAYREVASTYGMSDRDLRDVVTLYLLAGWMAANQADVPTVAQVRATRAQIGRVMEAAPPASNSPEQRQQLGERMMYDLVLIVAARGDGVETGDQQGLAALAGETTAAFRQRGFDPLAYRLTDDAGFESVAAN